MVLLPTGLKTDVLLNITLILTQYHGHRFLSMKQKPNESTKNESANNRVLIVMNSDMSKQGRPEG